VKLFQLLVVVFVSLFLSHHGVAGESRFSVQAGVGALVDTKTGLMWAMQDNGTDISWPGGEKFCEASGLAGFHDWRMPTREELATLYSLQAAETSEYYIQLQVKITACCQWAIDTDGPKVGSFDFEYGNRDWGYPMSTVDARVLPVRNVK